MFDTRSNPLVPAVLAALAVGAALGGCDSDAGGASLTTPGIVTDAPTGGSGAADSGVRIFPALDTLRVGDTARFIAVATDTVHTQQGERPVHWSVGDTMLASVDPTGVLRAKRPGTTSVTGAIGDSSRASATVVILDTTGTTSTIGLDRRLR